MTTTNIAYATSTAITIGLATTPLASNATFVAGRESSQIDNTSNKYDDALVQGKVTVGTTPTAGQIVVFVWGSDTSLATTALDQLDGTDSDETLTSVGVMQGILKWAATMNVDATTSDRTYYCGPFSVAALFGGVMPKYWGLYVAHNTVAALNSTAGNHAFTYTGITYTTA